MKIIELRFKNLNSLYGEWLIDFTAPEYVSNGIFALTGPTGAGKSTILDAICLALYGATPRLGKITKSENEIMSRQTGECYAEVVFQSQSGSYRCHWEQRRSRKKADGALQVPEHQIADAETGKPIETKKSIVSNVIEEKTGMDFDRFTRSILLAQGGFDTFLRADIEQKSKILEQITGTEIYTEISKSTHERFRLEKEKLNLLQAETSGIAVLEPDQENEILQELQNKQKQESELNSQLNEIEKAINWLLCIDSLKEEITSLSEEEMKILAEIDAFKPKFERLAKANRAAELDTSFATLSTMRKNLSIDREILKIEEDKLPELEKLLIQQSELLAIAESQTLKARETLKIETPCIVKVKVLDQQLLEMKNAGVEKAASYKIVTEKIDADKQQREKIQSLRIEAIKNLEQIEGYLQSHLQDEWLVSGLAGVQEQIYTLISKQKEIAQKESGQKEAEKALRQANEKLLDCTIKSGNCKKELDEISVKLQQEKDVLKNILGDRLLREYRTDKETLLREMAFMAKIAELESHRAKLEDGKPCPLCGATAHPFAEGNIPVPEEIETKIDLLTEIIRKAEDQEVAIRKLEIAENTARESLTSFEKLETAAVNDVQNLEKTISELSDNLIASRSELRIVKQAVLTKLHPLGISEISDTDINSLSLSLENRLEKWQVHKKKRDELERQISLFDSDLKRLDAIIDTQVGTQNEKQRELEDLRRQYSEGVSKRKELYGNKNPEIEETRLNKSITDAEANEKQSRILYEEHQLRLSSVKNNTISLKKQIELRNDELKELESRFEIALNSTVFSNEKEFLDARLSIDERNDLTKKVREFEDRKTDLKARQNDRVTRLTIEIQKRITDKTIDELKPQSIELEESLHQLRHNVAELKLRLSQNASAKELLKGKQTAIKAQKKECLRWEKLHSLIGSADGKKFRNFAQGLTFELMVSHANRQLQNMTDRYLLIRDDEEPLELNVVDNYQAGEIRSTKNLSGGESFIVSLSLALGLSKMSSRKVRVDSLFLDEGFGTLDEEALETALDALSGLHQDGKLIGIISHVSALKDRISTQITVAPVSGGKSTITGPGCCKDTREISDSVEVEDVLTN